MSRRFPERELERAGAPMELPPIGLPRPKLRGTTALETCLSQRRSTRQFDTAPISVSATSQLLWAAQGVTGLGGLRTAPSAGALYPLRTYLVAARVRALPAGLFKYDANDHYIRCLRQCDLREDLVEAGVDVCVRDAAGAIVLAADYRSASREFKDLACRLVHIEAGHAGQNVCLQATALGLGVIGLGAFDTDGLRRVLELREQEHPVYVLAFGRKVGSEPLV
jgi:SagB-type dehydrogenase family enzyme